MIKLYKYRYDAGLSQRALAEEIGCSANVVYSWEKGLVKRPYAELGAKLQNRFGVSIDELFSPENANSPGRSAEAA